MIKESLPRLLLTLAGQPPLNRLYRRIVQWRFRRLERARVGRPVLEWVAHYPILVLPEVLNPRLFYSGEFLAQVLHNNLVFSGSRVLDMGTGTGIVAIVAAHHGAKVTAVDINPAAVRCARLNALLNQVEPAVDVREGDLFQPVQDEQFDVVIFNPPYLAGEPRSPFERALYASDVIERFGANLAHYLRPAGYALLLLSSLADEAGFLHCLRTQGWTVTEQVATKLPLERLVLYRLTQEE